MDRNERRKFVSDLIENVEQSILARLDDMPDEWNGIELRQYIAESFTARCQPSRFVPSARKRSYRNEVLVRNL